MDQWKKVWNVDPTGCWGQTGLDPPKDPTPLKSKFWSCSTSGMNVRGNNTWRSMLKRSSLLDVVVGVPLSSYRQNQPWDVKVSVLVQTVILPETFTILFTLTTSINLTTTRRMSSSPTPPRSLRTAGSGCWWETRSGIPFPSRVRSSVAQKVEVEIVVHTSLPPLPPQDERDHGRTVNGHKMDLETYLWLWEGRGTFNIFVRE